MLIAFVFVLSVPTVASAHGTSGAGYVSTVTRVVDGEGIDATASSDGHFELTPPAGKTVIVNGYQHEPYLKFADGNVYENDSSPTTYVNKESTPPAHAAANADPEWVLQVGGPGWTWHDHRTHWMASEPPAAVRRDEHARHHIFDWVVDGTLDGRPFQIDGSLDWAPRKSGPNYEWLSLVAIGAFGLYVLYALVGRRTERRRGT